MGDGRETLFLAPPSDMENYNFDDIRPHAPVEGDATKKSRAQAEGEKLAAGLGFTDIRESSKLDDYLEAMAGVKTAWTLTEPEEYEATSRDEAAAFEQEQAADEFDGRLSRTLQFSKKIEEKYSFRIQSLNKHLDALRKIKTPEEIEAMRNASKIAAAGHIAAMRATRPGIREWQIGAEATAVFHRMGAPDVAYFPIVGTGRNALTLHYTNVGARVEADDVILMDFAPEWRYYMSDVTRSWPASGKFSERGRKIYEAVLKAQEAAIAVVKPGALFRDVEAAASRSLIESGFEPARYMWHGLSHSIGMSTHDVCGIGPKLAVGEVFTIEPGIYDRESGIGVRIEDVIVVTADGHDNLSKDAPKTVAEIEAITGRAASK